MDLPVLYAHFIEEAIFSGRTETEMAPVVPFRCFSQDVSGGVPEYLLSCTEIFVHSVQTKAMEKYPQDVQSLAVRAYSCLPKVFPNPKVRHLPAQGMIATSTVKQ